MRFVLDESADLPLADYLRSLGHDVTAIITDYTRGLPDRAVLAIANQDQRIVITNDRDFGELVFRQQLPQAGIIPFRLGAEDLATKIAWLDYVPATCADDLDKFIVVTDRGIRVRLTGQV